MIANQHQNPDLFWALRGGGGGTFGIVTSVTIRAYPEIPVVISKLHFKMPLKDGRFWNAITEQLRALPGLMEGGNAGEVSIFRLPGLDTDIFSAMTWYSMNISDTAQADNKFTSLREKFEKMGVTHMYTSDSVPKVGSFLSTPTGLDLGGIGQLHGSVLISHDFLRSGDGPSSISDAISRLEIDIGDAIVVNGLAGGQVISNKQIDSAVNPAWRSADLFVDVFRSLPSSAPPNLLRAASDKLTNVQMPVLQSIELGKMGSYLNVADPQQKNFQQAFWGDNYKKLYRLKKKWDRDGLFIVRQGVGSEDWDDEGMCPI